MGDFAELSLYRPVYLRPSVAVDIDPEGGDSVKVSMSVRVDEIAALALLDNQRVFSFPLFHLRERVPHMGSVEEL